MNNVSIDKILHIDLRNGISGDMLLGALLDLDVDKEYILNQLKSLNLNNYELKISSKTINGIKATDIKVDVPKKEHIHRTLLDITELIQKSDLNENVNEVIFGGNNVAWNYIVDSIMNGLPIYDDNRWIPRT